MAKRREQFRKQQIATVGHSDKFSRRMKALAEKLVRLKANHPIGEKVKNENH